MVRSANIIAFYGLLEKNFHGKKPLLKDGKNIRKTISSNFRMAAGK